MYHVLLALKYFQPVISHFCLESSGSTVPWIGMLLVDNSTAETLSKLLTLFIKLLM